MIAYMCKYTPVELLEAFGTPAAIMEPDAADFTQADMLMHPNMCCYVKAVLEDFEAGRWDGMLFTTCCDSARRLYDTLARLHPDKFFFCFDLPRKVDASSTALYAAQMERFIAEYSAFSGKTFDEGRLARICAEKCAMQERKRELASGGTTVEGAQAAADGGVSAPDRADLEVCLAGARPGAGIRQLIEHLGAHIALDLTCTGTERAFAVDADPARDFAGPDGGAPNAGDRRQSGHSPLLLSYAAALLGQIPCMRMAQVDGRAETLLAQADGLDGILYHTVKFCDIYAYEYTRFKQTIDLPIVKLETDATSQCAGQILTRIEAFLESLRARGKGTDACYGCPDYEMGASRLSMADIEADRGGGPGAMPDGAKGGTPGSGPGGGAKNPSAKEPARDFTAAAGGPAVRKGEKPMYIMGIDSGSTSTNAVIIDENKEILSFAVLRTGAKSAESAERIRAEVLEKAGLAPEDVGRVVSTGYGRVSIPFADKNVTEISCHGRGAHFVNPAVRTILDIGGQDSKAIRLNENGDVIDFVMNDKCAAGTGRFLEMMADTLEIGIEQLGPLSLKSRENVQISSMCSVFAESEVISLIAQNKEPADIAHGIHRAIAGKAMSLLKKVGLEREFMMTGGVAKNPGMVAVLEEMLGAPLFIYEEPEIVGALGAALYGLEEL